MKTGDRPLKSLCLLEMQNLDLAGTAFPACFSAVLIKQWRHRREATVLALTAEGQRAGVTCKVALTSLLLKLWGLPMVKICLT